MHRHYLTCMTFFLIQTCVYTMEEQEGHEDITVPATLETSRTFELEEFPTEIQKYIFSFLDPDEAARAEGTCKTFQKFLATEKDYKPTNYQLKRTINKIINKAVDESIYIRDFLAMVRYQDQANQEKNIIKKKFEDTYTPEIVVEQFGGPAVPTKCILQRLKQQLLNLRSTTADSSIAYSTASAPINMINLKENGIIYLSPHIFNLHDLKVLDLSCNNLQTLPLKIAQLTQLESLILNNNPALTLPLHTWKALLTLPSLNCVVLSNTNVPLNLRKKFFGPSGRQGIPNSIIEFKHLVLEHIKAGESVEEDRESLSL